MVAERSAWSLETPPLGGLPFQEERGGDSRVGSEAPASVATQMEAALSCDRDSFIGLAWGRHGEGGVLRCVGFHRHWCRHFVDTTRNAWRVIFCPQFAPALAHASFFGRTIADCTPRHCTLQNRCSSDGASTATGSQAMRHATRRGAGAGVASLLVKLLIPKHDWPVWKTSVLGVEF